MNLFTIPPLPADDELTELLASGKAVRIERIISTGQVSAVYDQEESEFVALLQGTATLAYESGEAVSLRAGDTVLIPPHTRHRVAYTSAEPPCVWLCVFWK